MIIKNTRTGMVSMGVLLLLVFVGSCKKTVTRWNDVKADPVTDTVAALKNNRIISYKIQSPSLEGIYAAIQESDSTINIYLPYFYSLNFLEVASIELPSGATIQPSADELVPVFAPAPFVYTVTAANKTTRKYTVKAIVLQEKLVINELSTASNTKTYNFNFNTNGLADVYFNITGGNIAPSGDYTTLHLMDAPTGGKEVLSGTLSPSDRPVTTAIAYYYRYDKNNNNTWRIKSGTDYWVEIRSYQRVHRMTYPVRFSGI